MRLVFAVLFTILCSILSHANSSCLGLFEYQSAPNSVGQDPRYIGLRSLQEKIEEAAIKGISPKEIVHLEFPELRPDIETQIEMLDRNLRSIMDPTNFFLLLGIIHMENLKQSLNRKLTLNTHYFNSLRTLILLDYIQTDRESIRIKLTDLQRSRLEKFMKGKFNQLNTFRSFPRLQKFFMEWSFAIHDRNFSKYRIPIFTTLELKLKDMNPFLSGATSIIGLIDHNANPDSIGTMGPMGFALHDITHISLSRRHDEHWDRVMTPPERKKLIRFIRKNYLAARLKLNKRAQTSLDILYFDFLHEDTNILPVFMYRTEQQGGTFKEEYDLDSKNVMNYPEMSGLLTTSRQVYKEEIPNSDLNIRTIETLAESVRPTWERLIDIWLKSYKALRE